MTTFPGPWIVVITFLLLPVSAAGADLVVVDSEGDPVAGAVVELRTEAATDDLLARLIAPSAEKRTGPGGSVDLALPAVRKLLIVDHPEFAPWGTELTADERPDRVVLDPGRSLVGVVMKREAPERGPSPSVPLEGTACVSWTDAREEWSLDRRTERCSPLEKDGRFEVRGLPASDSDGGFELTARADGFLPARRALASLEPAPRDVPIRLELARGVLLTGRVIGARGDGVSHAKIRDASGDAEATSGAEGGFDIAVEELPGTLIASAPGHRGERVPVPRPPTAERPLIVSLEPAEGIRGVIVAEEGIVPDGARISWEVRRDGMRARDHRALESDDGTFSFDLPGPGDYLLKAEADGYQHEALPILFVQPGESVDLGILELSRGGGVEGRVVDAESGEGLAGVSVELLPAGLALVQAAEMGVPSGVTDHEGRFGLFGVEGGRYELRARRAGYATRTDEEIVRRNEVTSLDTISFDDGTEVRLRLVDRAGEPRAGLAVRVLDHQREVLVPVAVGRSALDGYVTPLVLAAGRYRLEVEGDRLLLAQGIEIPSGDDELERELTVGGVDLTGIVRRSGEPVTGGVLSLTSALDPGNSRGKLLLHGKDGRSASYGLSETAVSAEVAADGTFRIPDAPAGLLFAVWRGAEGRPVHREVLVPDRPRAVIEIDLGGLALTGWVREVGGSPVAGASVTVTGPAGRSVGAGRSGDDGRFAISDLTPGEYRLEVTAPERAPRSLTARVDDGSPPIEGRHGGSRHPALRDRPAPGTVPAGRLRRAPILGERRPLPRPDRSGLLHRDRVGGREPLGDAGSGGLRRPDPDRDRVASALVDTP